MREFVLLALRAWSSPDFNIDDLPNAGRLDLVCRSISSVLNASQGVRPDTVLHVVLGGPKHPPKIVSFYGRDISCIPFDERSLALILRKALRVGIELKLGEQQNVAEGVIVAKKAFETLIREKASTQILYLHQKGDDIRNVEFQANITFIFGDFMGLPSKTEKLLARLGAQRVSLGPVMIFASHCPIIIHNELDRYGKIS